MSNSPNWSCLIKEKRRSGICFRSEIAQVCSARIELYADMKGNAWPLNKSETEASSIALSLPRLIPGKKCVSQPINEDHV